MNHPFVDGNKRSPFFDSDAFLRPGWKFDVESGAAHSFLIRLPERGECDFEDLLHWNREARVEEKTAARRRR